jgi:putative transposase
MTTITAPAGAGKAAFELVAAAFLDQPGLPFADVLNAGQIDDAFGQRDAMFAQDAIYSTPIVLWAFLAQVLRDGKGAACKAAVADIATYTHQCGQPVPAGDTGDYCRARAKLDPAALRELVQRSASQLEAGAHDDWLWRGRHAKLVDGFTFTMPDTPANQEAFPQTSSQAPGVGFPLARACAVLSLSTAAILDLAIGPYQGKETGETALLRTMLDGFTPGDVAVFDRYYGSYMMLALLANRGVDVCTRLHQCRSGDFRQGRYLGDYDCLATWRRPLRPTWMTPEQYAEIPETFTVRMLQFDVTESGRRVETIDIVTTLTDPAEYPKEAIAELYGYRWNAELDIRDIKQTLNLNHARCKSPEMIERELWVTLLGYNLIRRTIARAAALHDRQPRQIGFTLACQTLLSSWTLAATGSCRDVRGLTILALRRIAGNEVANRPGRIEPRVLKRRKHGYPLMKLPREELRKELQ